MFQTQQQARLGRARIMTNRSTKRHSSFDFRAWDGMGGSETGTAGQRLKYMITLFKLFAMVKVPPMDYQRTEDLACYDYQ